jgi:hypothetical protein
MDIKVIKDSLSTVNITIVKDITDIPAPQIS